MNLQQSLEKAIFLQEKGRVAEAERLYTQVLAAAPDHIVALNNRGIALMDMRRFDEALASFNKVLALKPDLVEALNNRGLALSDLKRFEDALASYQAALAIDPRHAGVLNNRGMILAEMLRTEEALSSFDTALAIDPDYADAQYNRGKRLLYANRIAEALASFQRVRAIDPNYPGVLGSMADASRRLCDWHGTAVLASQMEKEITAGKSAIDPFVLLAYSDNVALQFQCAQNYVRDRIPVQQSMCGRVGSRNDRIKIAYLSADFHEHPTAHLMAELFERHDRSRFEISAISFGLDDHSEMRSRLTKAFDHFVDVRGGGDYKIACMLKAKQVDIAIDLKGHTANNRLGILSYRPAPVQANYLGYPGTLGAGFIDYIIADPVVAPFAQQPFYAEKIVHLPDCYQANDSTRAIAGEAISRKQAGLPEHGFVFCCFNNSWKITAPVFKVWMRLLGAVPASVFWLFEGSGEMIANLRDEARACGIDPQRLVFAPRLQLKQHLARHRLADLFLDTLPYNAHTTASDALWAGLPLVTCEGQSFASRVAASLLHAIGLPELVTNKLEDYEALALKLARDERRLKSIRMKLSQNRLTHPLFDADRFRRNIEAAYTKMWQIAERGDAPQSFAVEA